MKVSVKSELRAIYNTYGGSLSWSPAAVKDLGLHFSIFGQRLISHNQTPDSNMVGLEIGLLSDEGTSSPGYQLSQPSVFSDVEDWVKAPAVYMERVLAIAEQRTTLNAPLVGSIQPNSGPFVGGNTVTITGSNFLPGVTVTFAGTSAAVTLVSSTELSVVVPELTPPLMSTLDTSETITQSVNIVVQNPNGQKTVFTQAYTYTTAFSPTLDNVSPATGVTAGGTLITLTGSNLTGTSSVTLDGINATDVAVVSDTRVTALTPAHDAGTVNIVLTSPNGEATLIDSYTYINPTPTVTNVSPSSGPASGGTSVTITGTNFTSDSTVSFGGTAGTSVTVNSSTSITATSPAGSGTVNVTVTTPGGTSAISSADQFTYFGLPTVTTVSPSMGEQNGGDSVTITGTNFTYATAVNFGATSVSFTIDSDTQITAITAFHVGGIVDVTVTNPSGTSATSSADQYGFYGTPSITSINPTVGPSSGGTSVVIAGVNFSQTTQVNFGVTPATSFTIDRSSQITAVAPAGTGTVDITVSNPLHTSTTSSADEFTYAATPTVTNISPTTGPTAGGTSVTITGTNFTSDSTVRFGSTAGTGVTVNSASSITVTSPAGSGTVDVTVTTPGGTSSTSSADQYQYGVPIIFSTTTLFNGNLGGLSGADSKCNATGSGKPTTGFAANYTYKALLNGNNATTSGVTYYRKNGTTVIATATDGNLVGSSTLVNSISTTSDMAWTGAFSNCSSWNSSNFSATGTTGSADSVSSTYWSNQGSSCSVNRNLYCVSQ